MKDQNCENCKWGPHENTCHRTVCTYEKADDDFLRKKQEFDFLDSLDLPADFFEGYIDEVMRSIEDKYTAAYKDWQKIEDDDIFNLIDEFEFFSWVHKRFPYIFIQEEVRHYFSRSYVGRK